MLKKIMVSDLKPGMFVDHMHSSWLNAPFAMKNFEITSQSDIDKIRYYDIKYVSIDTQKGIDLPHARPVTGEDEPRSIKDVFTAQLSDFWINRATPVDFYLFHNGTPKLVLRKGLSFSAEVIEQFQEKNIGSVKVPTSQKKDYERYRKKIEAEKEERENRGFKAPFSDPEREKRYLDFMSRFRSVNPAVLQPGFATGFDMFTNDEHVVCLCHEKSGKVSEDQRGEWVTNDANLLVRVEDRQVYKDYMLKLARNSSDPCARAGFVLENSKLIVEELAENPRSGKLMKDTRKAVSDISAMIQENPTTFYGLMKINNYDYYTFTHSVNVATLCLALAMSAGIDKKEDLDELGLGATLHDIGKARVESALINKPGRLTPQEYRKVKNHVILGHQMLMENPAVTKRAMYPLLEHHEKLSGAGYPNGLKGDQVHTFGRIAAIVDIYDALTTERSYKKAFKPFDALTFLSKHHEDYDQDMFSVLVELVHEQEL